MNKPCKHKQEDGFHNCGSWAFNLHQEGIEQGGLCDVHYWQSKYFQAKLEIEDLERGVFWKDE
jgi:hypothetical protein